MSPTLSPTPSSHPPPPPRLLRSTSARASTAYKTGIIKPLPVWSVPLVPTPPAPNPTDSQYSYIRPAPFRPNTANPITHQASPRLYTPGPAPPNSTSQGQLTNSLPQHSDRTPDSGATSPRWHTLILVKSNSVNVGSGSQGCSKPPNTDPGTTADYGNCHSSSAAQPSPRLISHHASKSWYISIAHSDSKPPGSPNRSSSHNLGRACYRPATAFNRPGTVMSRSATAGSSRPATATNFVFWPSCEHPGPAVSHSASHHGAVAAAGAAAVAALEETCHSRSFGMGRPKIDGRTRTGSRIVHQPLQAAFSRGAPLQSTLIRPTTAFSPANLSQFYAGMPSAEEDIELDAKFDRIAGGEGGGNRHEHCNSSGGPSIRLLCTPGGFMSGSTSQFAVLCPSVGRFKQSVTICEMILDAGWYWHSDVCLVSALVIQ